jgi:hypothetical protein
MRFVAHALGMSDLPALPATVRATVATVASTRRDRVARPADTCALAAAFSEVRTAAEAQTGLCMSDRELVMGNSLGKRRAKVCLRGEVSIALTKALSMLGLSEHDRASISNVTLRTVSSDAKLELCLAPVRSLVVAAPLDAAPVDGLEETGGVWWHSSVDGESALGPFIFALQSPSRKAGTVLKPHTVIPGHYTDIHSSGDVAGASLCPLSIGEYYLFRPPNITYADSRSPSLAVLEPRRFLLCTLCFSDSETAATCSIELGKSAVSAESAEGENDISDGSGSSPSPGPKKTVTAQPPKRQRRRQSLAVGRQTRQRTVQPRRPAVAAVLAASDANPACDQQPPSPPSSPRCARRLARGVGADSRTKTLSDADADQNPSRTRSQSPTVRPQVQVRGRGVGARAELEPAAVSNAASDGVATEVLRGRRR